MAETLIYDVLARIRGADEMGKLAAVSDLAAAGSKRLKESLADLGKRGDVTAAQMTALGGAVRRFGDDEDKLIVKTLAADASIRRLDDAMKDGATHTGNLAKSAESALPGLSGMGGAMGAAVAAGVALAPVLVTLGTGLAGFGLAAYGAIGPVLKASEASGGLAKNMHKLNAEQQAAAKSLLAVKQDFAGFQKDLQPVVLTDFGKAAKFAGDMLHNIEPVSKGVGIGIGQLLDRVDAEFASSRWQDFFAFMGQNAVGDMQLLTSNLVDLLHVLPPLLQDLQPFAVALLTVTDAAAKAANVFEILTGHLNIFEIAAGGLLGPVGLLGGVFHATFVARDPSKRIAGMVAAMRLAPPAAGGVAVAMGAAATAVNSAATAVDGMDTSWNTLVGDFVSSQQTLLTWRQDMLTLAADAKQPGASMRGTTAASLALQAQFYGSLGAIKDHAEAMRKNGISVDKVNTFVHNADRSLMTYTQHNPAAVKALELQNLWAGRLYQTWASLHDKSIHVAVDAHGNVTVTGAGPRAISGGPVQLRPLAAGGRLPGYGGGDRVPALLEPGETVVDKQRTAALAPVFKAAGVPGFAAGGYVGSPKGLPPWLSRTVSGMEWDAAGIVGQVLRAELKAGLADLMAAGGGPGGGARAANAALARSLYQALLGPGDWAAWNYVAMRESGWNQFARNPASGAYGIPQALPESKLPFAGQAAGGSNPMAQIGWMWNYMAGRYGGPRGAAAHEMAYNWYGNGSWNVPVTGPAVVHKGEMIIPAEAAAAVRSGGGNTYNITVNMPFGSTRAEVENGLTAALERLAKQGRLP